ncbi:GntR family transcriptional regulator [Shimia sp. Alg240-R146]|uniref:GntR family transcriptional regulator n=1 Tax=Shimia sp. Alg240-R146 TaxID=2993449 RepID=UPI0022E2AE90|nr:GntR family transcriptional regulator [Shimia sp. Alg240-R146]
MLVDQILSPLPQAAAASATDQVFDRLHAAIIALELPPGSKVSEADLAGRFDVSRQPVRDAFFRLSQQGFLLIRPQRATLVTKISVAAVARAAFVRSALETACLADSIQRRTNADLAALDALIEQQHEAMQKADGVRFYELDETFHQLLCAISGHDDIWPLVSAQKSHMDRARRLSLPDNGPVAFQEHCEIVAALRQQDLRSAQDQLAAHLHSLFPLMDGIRAKNPEFFEDDT